MPVRSVISTATQFVLSEAEGILTAEQMLANQKALLGHASFELAFRRIYNLTRITDFQVSAAQMRDMPFPYAPGAKRALVAENDLVFGMARMYQMMREEQHQGALHVYRSLAEALQWVGMTSDEYASVAANVGRVASGAVLSVD